MKIKKIVTKDDQERKRKRNYILIGVVMVLLMVISPAGYTMLQDKDNSQVNSIKYNGIDFVKDGNGYWEFQYNSQAFITQYNPLELNDTKVSTLFSLSSYNGQVLSFDWNDSQEGVAELDRNLEGNKIPLRVVPKACLSEDCPGNYPIKDCSVDNVISFRYPVNNEAERVYTDENCVFIVANQTNQIKYADAFLYNILGIK